jgi:hypothetical protein|tara:strand:+ start:439 stop:714 length:276 start_codon:yes stop_codon:yes gene_type:complete
MNFDIAYTHAGGQQYILEVVNYTPARNSFCDYSGYFSQDVTDAEFDISSIYLARPLKKLHPRAAKKMADYIYNTESELQAVEQAAEQELNR